MAVDAVEDLTDKELRDALLLLGEKPGPITGTTRRVYEQWLTKLQKEQKNKRRRTLDTSLLRSTEKPKQSRRRSEQPRVPSARIKSINLSDVSDSEVATLDHPPPGSLDTVHPPPGSLLISTDNNITPKRDTRRSSGRLLGKNSLFSDDDLILDQQPVTRRRVNLPKKSLELTEPKREVKPAKGGGGWAKGILYILLLVCLVLGIIVYTLHSLYSTEPVQSVAEPCYSLSKKRNISLAECDRLYNKIVKDKQEFDLYTGEVLCGQIEGVIYKELPIDPKEQELLFDLREALNVTFYRKREDLYFELDSQIELETLEFNLNQAPESYFYITTTPHRSWLCVLYQAINSIAYYIVASILILMCLEVLRKLYRWKQSKAKRETGQMYELIDQIIEELQRNYSKYQTDPTHHVPYVPIPHARDRLLLPSERGHMKKIWERAVQFIAEHESRVRVEMRRVQSEDFPVWYWLEAAKPAVTRVQADSTSTEFPFSAHTDFLYPDLDLEPVTST